MDLDRIFCIEEEKRVQGDNTISYQGRRYQILPTEKRYAPSYKEALMVGV